MVTLAKKELEQMLGLLSLSTLEAINNKCLQENYTYGAKPLLQYAPEALSTYASAVYRYILPHFGAVELTEDEYIAKWLVPYTKLQEQLKAKESDFIGTLVDITLHPISESDPFIIVTPKECLYTQIANFLSGKDSDLYVDVLDFLFNIYSPLRKDTVTDPRVHAIIAEVGALCVACNAELTAFIGKELKKYMELFNDRLAYYKLKPKMIAMLTAHKAQISQSDWDLISLALEDKVITDAIKKLISKSLKAINQSIKKAKTAKPFTINPVYPKICAEVDLATKLIHYLKRTTTETNSPLYDALAPYVELTQRHQVELACKELVQSHSQIKAVISGIKELFIRNFVEQLGSAYTIPKPVEKQPLNSTLDDLFGKINAVYLAQEQAVSYDAVETQKTSNENWYKDFNHIRQSLSALLQITLNSTEPSTVLVPEVLSHGAIQGMLAFAEFVNKQLGEKVIVLDCEQLAKELRHQLLVHTDYYLEAEPLPEVRPLNNEQLSSSTRVETTSISATLSTLFDLTQPIQELLDRIQANVVTTGVVKFLSAKDVDTKSLVPVPDCTINEMATMLTGQPSTPYLIDGNLIIHVTATNKYVQPIPTIRDDGYTEYTFRAYSWDTLNNHIHSLQRLLAKTPNYIEWQTTPEPILAHEQPEYKPIPKDYSYTLLPKDVELRKSACVEAVEHLEHLLTMANNIFDNDDETGKKALKQVENIEMTHYYKDCSIIGHRLSSWVHDTDEYAAKISSKPVDAKGQRIYYEPNHINGNRSDNRSENLKIELKQDNLDLRSTSRPVVYAGTPYLTLKKYCDAEGLSYSYLKDCLGKLQPGVTYEHSSRVYSLGTDGQTYIVIDAEAKAPAITFNGKAYAELKEFTTEAKLSYDSIQKGISRARNAGETEYRPKNKKYIFYLGENGSITITA